MYEKLLSIVESLTMRLMVLHGAIVKEMDADGNKTNDKLISASITKCALDIMGAYYLYRISKKMYKREFVALDFEDENELKLPEGHSWENYADNVALRFIPIDKAIFDTVETLCAMGIVKSISRTQRHRNLYLIGNRILCGDFAVVKFNISPDIAMGLLEHNVKQFRDDVYIYIYDTHAMIGLKRKERPTIERSKRKWLSNKKSKLSKKR